MVERRSGSSPDSPVAMPAFGVSCRTEAFGNKTPLHGEILPAIYRTGLINGPADGTMINHHILAVHAAQSVRLTSALIAYTETQVTDNHIFRINRNRATGYADTLSGGSLAGNSQVTIHYTQATVQKDCSRHIKYNGTCPLLHHGMTQCSLPGAILQGRDMIHLAATSAGSVTSKTFGTGKCR